MRSWYDFSDSSGVGKLAVKELLVGFYENGKCYDECRFSPDNALTALTFLGVDQCKVFVIFNNEDILELTAKEVNWKNV